MYICYLQFALKCPMKHIDTLFKICSKQKPPLAVKKKSEFSQTKSLDFDSQSKREYKYFC